MSGLSTWRVGAAAILASLLISSPAESAAGDACGDWRVGMTGGDGAYLQARPALNTVIDLLPDGTRLADLCQERLSTGFVWRRVQSRSGATGWVPRMYLVRDGAVELLGTWVGREQASDLLVSVEPGVRVVARRIADGSPGPGAMAVLQLGALGPEEAIGRVVYTEDPDFAPLGSIAALALTQGGEAVLRVGLHAFYLRR